MGLKPRHNPKSLSMLEVWASRDASDRERADRVCFWSEEPIWLPQAGLWEARRLGEKFMSIGQVAALPDARGECPLVSFGNCVRLRLSQTWQRLIVDDMSECHYDSAREAWESGYQACLVDVVDRVLKMSGKAAAFDVRQAAEVLSKPKNR